MTFFSAEADLVADALRRLDLTKLTPLEALNKLEELQRQVLKNSGGPKNRPGS